MDCETVVYDLTSTKKRKKYRPIITPAPIPILFVPWERPGVPENLLTCFGALAIAQVTGKIPAKAILIYGNNYCRKTLNTDDFIIKTQNIIDRIRDNWQERKPPLMVLNRHCAICDFQPRCRRIATERDDLSLLTAMTAKERAKCAAKGISSITQLSYGYRPRRRKRIRPDTARTTKSGRSTTQLTKNDFKLRALAIKKSQIHVVGSPSLKSVASLSSSTLRECRIRISTT